MPGEPLDSWLEAYAHRTKIPTADLLWALALPNANTVMLRDDEAVEIERQTGVPVQRLHAMTLRCYAGHAIAVKADRRIVAPGGPLWGRASGSRYCPQCLVDRDGRWLLRWRLSWVFACAQHKTLLIDACPACGAPPRTNGKARPDHPTPGVCGGRLTPTQPCLTDLRTTSDSPHLDHDLLATQEFIDEQLRRIECGDTDRDPAPAVLFADLGAVASWILRTAQPGDFLRFGDDIEASWQLARQAASRRTRPGQLACRDAGVVGAALTVAMSVVATDDDTAIPVLRRLLGRRTGYAGVATVRSLGRRWDHTSPNLRRLIWRARDWELAPIDRLRFRTCTHHPREPDDQAVERARHVPQILWPGWTVQLMPPAGFHFDHFRAVAAAALLVPGGRQRAWERAWTALGVPVPRKASHVLTKLAENGHFAVLAAICALADYLDRHGAPIDYQRRRDVIGNDLLPAPHWRQLCDATATQPTPARLHDARRWLYERLTGNNLLHAPAPFTLTDPHDRATYQLLALRLRAPLLSALDDYARDHLAALGIDEPVTWGPPPDAVHGLDLPGARAAVDPAVLHRLLRDDRLTPGQAAHHLGTTIDHVRLILAEMPPPSPNPAPHSHIGAIQRRRCVRETLTPEYLRAAHAAGIGLRGISRDIGFDRKLVAEIAAEQGLVFTPGRRAVPVDRDWLHHQYIVRRRTLPDIAAELGMSAANLNRRARELGLPLRPRGGASHTDALALPDEQLPAIIQRALTGSLGWQRLRRFLAAMQFDTLTDAARALGIAQATLTSQFERLEHDTGKQLFVRAERDRPMHATRHGQHLLRALANLEHG